MNPTVRAEGGVLVIADRAGNRLVWTYEDAMAIATGIMQEDEDRARQIRESDTPTARAGGTREGTR